MLPLRTPASIAVAISVLAFAATGCGGHTAHGRAAQPIVTLGNEPVPRAPRRVRASARKPAPAEQEGRELPSVSSTLITHGPRNRRAVALTFDADMTRGMLANLRAGRVARYYDPSIVRYLRSTGTAATIFSTGLFARVYPGVIRSLSADPLFEIENHSLDHSGWTASCYGLPAVAGVPSKREEVEQSAAILERATGERPRYFRFPGGCHTGADARLVASLGEQPVGWDVVSGDPFQPSADVVVRNVLRGTHAGSIVVMHLNGAPNAPATSTALRRVVPVLREDGYRFVTLDDLLRRG